MLRSRMQLTAAVLALAVGAAATLSAQKTGTMDSSMAGGMSHQMMHQMESTAHGGTMSMPMAAGSPHGMGAMPGMMGMGATSQITDGMASHMTQMLGVMQERLVRIQALLKDSAVARSPQSMHDLRLMQHHMASMMAVMGPIIARMEQMQRTDTPHERKL